MKNAQCAICIIFSLLCLSSYANDGNTTNLIVTPNEVDPKSVRLTATNSPWPNLTFKYVGKTPEEIRAIAKKPRPVLVVKDGVVVAKASTYGGHVKVSTNSPVEFIGLTIIFDELGQAKLAEKALRGMSQN